ncbi:MAG: hypothetical protein HGGPFJEG_00072 [Ignavibacteria bacterium]|nr:hypothetical protein [Ignavibacteria bacterium]
MLQKIFRNLKVNHKSKFTGLSSALFLLICLSVLPANLSYAQEADKPRTEIGIYERLGEKIPNDVVLYNEYGQQVNLKTLVSKPTIISFVYFRCPGICTPLLNGIVKTVDMSEIEPGEDYDIITISFDPSEDYKLAAEKKENYLEQLDRKIPQDAWRFLSGDSLNILKITDALGFKYEKKDSDYIHSAAIMVLSPEGKIVRYLYGTDFLPFDFKMAVTEAQEGKAVPSISKIVKMCFSYDPEGRKYVLNLTRIVGAGMILMLGFFVVLLNIKKKKNNNNT